MIDSNWEVSKKWSKKSKYVPRHQIFWYWYWLYWKKKGKESNMYFVKPKNLKVLTSFLPFFGPVYSQLPPMSMHFKHDSSSLIASIWKSGTCFSLVFLALFSTFWPKVCPRKQRYFSKRLSNYHCIQSCSVSKETFDLTVTRGTLWSDKV